MADNVLQYNPGVRAVRETGLARLSTRGMREFQDLGSRVTSVSTKYMDKLAREKSEAQVAESSAQMKLEWDAAEATMSKMRDPKEIEEFYETWESEQKAKLNEAELTDMARANIDNGAQGFFANTRISAVGQGGYRDKAEIGIMDATWTKQASLALTGETGEFATPQEYYNNSIEQRVSLGTLAPAQAEEMKIEFETKHNRVIQSLAVSNAQLAYVEDQDEVAYIGRLEEIKEQNEELPMTITGKESLNEQINYKIIQTKGAYTRKLGTALRNLQLDASNGELDPSDLRKMRAEFGDTSIDAALAVVKLGLITDARGNAKAKQSLNIANKVLDGNLDAQRGIEQLEALEATDGDASRYAAIAVIMQTMSSEEGVEKQASTYDKLLGTWETVNLKSGTFLADVARNVQAYMVYGNADAQFFSDTWKKAVAMSEGSESWDLETRKKKLTDLFGEEAKKVISDSYNTSTTPGVKTAADLWNEEF